MSWRGGKSDWEEPKGGHRESRGGHSRNDSVLGRELRSSTANETESVIRIDLVSQFRTKRQVALT